MTGSEVSGGPLRVGIDLGGTSSRIVALDHSGQVISEQLVDTRSFAAGDAAGVVQRLVEHVRAVAGGQPVKGVGIGASGPVDTTGVIRNPDTLPEFSGIDLTSLVSAKLGVPCVIDSDAVTFALGEFHLGAARDAQSVVGVTLGTGVGVGVVVDGRPHRGGDGIHPEGGHIPIPGPPAPCYCGLTSCWEQRASRTALERMAAERFGNSTVAAVAAAAADGDARARAAFTEYGGAVGIGLTALATLFRPETIVIGGGSTPYLDLFMDGLRAAVARRGMYATNTEIVPSELGVLAGAIGAATLV